MEINVAISVNTPIFEVGKERWKYLLLFNQYIVTSSNTSVAVNNNLLRKQKSKSYF